MAGNSPRPRELYRDPAHGKIAGICAGLGRYFDWPVWPIRLAFVLLAVFTQFFPLVAAYLIAWFILDPISPHSPHGLRGQVDGWVMHTRSKWDQGRGAVDMPPQSPQPESEASNPGTSSANSANKARASYDAAEFRHVAMPADADSLEVAFSELERKVQAMERHVTEPAFVLRQQFRSL